MTNQVKEHPTKKVSLNHRRRGSKPTPGQPFGRMVPASDKGKVLKILVEPAPVTRQDSNETQLQSMSGSRLQAIKPAYVFTPKTLLRRIWMKVSPPRTPQKIMRLPWGSEIEVDIHDTIGGEIFKQGIFDIGVSECAWRLLNPGDRVLDAGANIGYMTSLFAAKVGQRGEVNSFEPHPVIRKRLLANINRFSHNGSAAKIVVHDCALGDVNGTATLCEDENFASNQGGAFLADASTAKAVAKYPVDIKLLDNVIPTGEFQLLKIDVEGHELKVIQGAKKLLGEKRVRHVIYEDHTQGKSGIPDIFTGFGYKIFSIGHTLWGLELKDSVTDIALDTSWESPSYLATIDPAYVNSRIGKGWQIFKGH